MSGQPSAPAALIPKKDRLFGPHSRCSQCGEWKNYCCSESKQDSLERYTYIHNIGFLWVLDKHLGQRSKLYFGRKHFCCPFAVNFKELQRCGPTVRSVAKRELSSFTNLVCFYSGF